MQQAFERGSNDAVSVRIAGESPLTPRQLMRAGLEKLEKYPETWKKFGVFYVMGMTMERNTNSTCLPKDKVSFNYVLRTFY